MRASSHPSIAALIPMNPENESNTSPSPEAAPTQGEGEGAPSETTPREPAEPAAAAAEAAQAGPEGEAAESGDEEEGEGEEPAAEGAGAEGAGAEGATAEGAPKKKRRRRRKKKPGAAAEGAEGQPPAEGQHAEGHEGEHKERRPKPEPLPFRIGEEVFGKVEGVTDDVIWIDVAGKALGIFDRRELGEGEPPQPGDQFIATVASHGVRGGVLRMARAPFVIDDSKAKVEKAKEAEELVEGFVTASVKGGIEVDIDGLRAFAPASHVELRPGGDLSHLVGRRLNFVVLQYEKKGRDIVVSRKKFLQEEAQQARAGALKSLEPGSVHKGVVRTVVQWGVFVALTDANNLEGLIHATEASHDRSAKLTDLFKPGDPVEVKVLKVDEKGKIWLSRKAMTNDPWDAVAQKYAVGTRHTGKIVRLQPFGAFIELEPGIDGLCYTADMSLKPIAHPKDMVKIDDTMEVVVATCDSATRKISLHPAPPEDEAGEPRPKVGPHRVVKVAVVQQSDAGLLVRVIGLTGRAARGFIPAGHTGTQRGTDLRKVFPVGTKLEAKVLDVDTRRGETKLSIRAMKEDAEKAAYQEYREQVNREAKFGTFADLLKKN
ncbi:MAG: 30S ribosomal protein S1 [Myxococcales bacterium]|nr:30S ribosomal protein S1 [Myxococcales bacterium]